ncbi:MAG: M1 family metallopeptidase [Bacteroidota bacterium]
MKAMLEPSFIDKSILGTVNYEFNVFSIIDTIRIDAINMDFDEVKINNAVVKFKNNGKELLLFEGFKNGINTLKFQYKATPKQTLYFTGEKENLQIWTQGQGKYTSHWLPSFDDVNEKVIFNMTVVFDKEYTIISNGLLYARILKETSENKLKSEYRMRNPMPSYLVMLAIGKFDKKTIKSKSGIPLEMYYQPKDSAKIEPTYRHSKKIFDFLEKEIGIPYPWEVYKQIPVEDFLYAGMENTSATLFSQDYVVDSIGYNDRNYINVNAHELAHQWFGDMVTAKNGKHHWLQEGFATYYALLAERQIFGEDYFYQKLYDSMLQIVAESKKGGTPILSENASSLTYYQKGAWAIHFLRSEVGEKTFKKAVKNYLKKYAFKNVDTNEFLNEVQKLSHYDVDKFSKEWLESTEFPIEKAILLLKKNKMIVSLLEIEQFAESPLNKKELYETILKSDTYFSIKEEIINQLTEIPFEEKASLIRLAMQSNDFRVRQMIAKTIPKIPIEFKEEYRTLLNDKSYLTQEIALNTFWSQFPDEQKTVLDKSKNWVGFNDRNLRMLWLTLALITKEYEKENKAKYYDELLNYCSPKFDSSIRQNAIEKLFFINENDKNVLPFLVNATTSFRWQFSKFGRDYIRVLLKNKSYRNYFDELLPQLPENEKKQLSKLLKE